MMMLPLFGEFFYVAKKKNFVKKRKTPNTLKTGLNTVGVQPSKKELIYNKKIFLLSLNKRKKRIGRYKFNEPKKGMKKSKGIFFVSSSVTIIIKLYKPKHISIHLPLMHRHIVSGFRQWSLLMKISNRWKSFGSFCFWWNVFWWNDFWSNGFGWNSFWSNNLFSKSFWPNLINQFLIEWILNPNHKSLHFEHLFQIWFSILERNFP